MKSKLLYHMTDYRNLSSILYNRSLRAYSQITNKKISYTDIAYLSVQQRRATTPIRVSPHGMLHDYVPFYFAPRSPMLYTIRNENVEGYSGSESDIIYLITRTDLILKAEKEFVFTDGHAIIKLTEFFNDMNDLDRLDWNVMESKYWNETDEDPDRKRRRQAEFLVYQFVELKLFLGIAVKNEKMQQIVVNILRNNNIDMRVLIRPGFYF